MKKLLVLAAIVVGTSAMAATASKPGEVLEIKKLSQTVPAKCDPKKDKGCKLEKVVMPKVKKPEVKKPANKK